MKNKLFELAARRRSVRKYTSEHIPDEVIREIMKVALTAPCGLLSIIYTNLFCLISLPLTEITSSSAHFESEEAKAPLTLTEPFLISCFASLREIFSSFESVLSSRCIIVFADKGN